jgi:hypothetical protein
LTLEGFERDDLVTVLDRELGSRAGLPIKERLHLAERDIILLRLGFDRFLAQQTWRDRLFVGAVFTVVAGVLAERLIT